MLEYKFPRTKHICKLAQAAAAITPDDLVAADSEVVEFMQRSVLLEEKADGANLGISFRRDWTVQVQKRGGVVTPDKEPQFSKLQTWLDRHEAELAHVLEQRYILFGEWLQQEHSMAYDCLPDWFLAFDVFDKRQQHFLSRARRIALLQNTSIVSVAAFDRRTFANVAQLTTFVERLTSKYMTSETAPEGVVLKLEQDGWTVARSKLVLPHFAQRIEAQGFWTHKRPVLNVVRPDVWLDQRAEDTTDGPAAEFSPERRKGDAVAPALGPPTHVAALRVHMSKGALVASGPALDEAVRAAVEAATAAGRVVIPPANLRVRIERDGTDGHHVTLASAAELRTLLEASEDQSVAGHKEGQRSTTARRTLLESTEQAVRGPWRVLGVGTVDAGVGSSSDASCVTFAPVLWPAAVGWRRSVGLATARYWPHATIGLPRSGDRHDVAKGLETCVWSHVCDTAAAAGQLHAIAALAVMQIAAGATMPVDHHGSDACFAEALQVLSDVTAKRSWAESQCQGNNAGAAADWGKLRAAALVALSMVEMRRQHTRELPHAYSVAVAHLTCNEAPGSEITALHEHALLAITAPIAQGEAMPVWRVIQAHHDAVEAQRLVRRKEWDRCRAAAESALEHRMAAFSASASLGGASATNISAILALTLLECCVPNEAKLRQIVESCQRRLEAMQESAHVHTEESDISDAAAAISTSFDHHATTSCDFDLASALHQARLHGAGGFGAQVTPAERVYLSVSGQIVKMPRNLSWVIPGQIIGCSKPVTVQQLDALRRTVRLGTVVTLMDEADEVNDVSFLCKAAHVQHIVCPVPDGSVPASIETMDRILDAVRNGAQGGKVCLVHCGGGKGRAGTALSCLLMRFGPPQNLVPPIGETRIVPPVLNAPDAIAYLRALRPGSVENAGQEHFVREYSSYLWSRCAAESADLDSETEQAQGAHGHTTPGSDGTSGGEPTQDASAARAAPEHSCSSAEVALSGQHAGHEMLGTEDIMADAGRPPGRYPSTPHLPFSPGISPDDSVLSHPIARRDELGIASASIQQLPWGRDPVIILEKLDGSNCCIFQGQVYARTHGHPATHPSFSHIKARASAITAALPARYALFGENMAAVHAITYGELRSPFYAFAVLDTARSRWCDWEHVTRTAAACNVPVVPVRYRGVMKAADELETWIKEHMAQGSALGGECEGFVVRPEQDFAVADFATRVAKYVRAHHVQPGKSSQWRRTWQAATIRHEGAHAALETPEGRRDHNPLTDAADAHAAAAEHKSSDPSDLIERSSAGAADSNRSTPLVSIASAAAGKPSKGRSSRARHRALPKLLVLCGLPGSGKSTFAEHVVSGSSPGRWWRVSQDEAGGRRAAEGEFVNAMKRATSSGTTYVILDRCNPTAADRKGWLDVGMVGKHDRVEVVWFDVPASVCVERVKARTDHPTIPHGRGERAVRSFQAQFEVPTVSEGFAAVHVVRSLEDASALCSRLLV